MNALEQAKEALKLAKQALGMPNGDPYARDAVSAALASLQSPAQEPVAWRREKQGMFTYLEHEPEVELYGSGWEPLYASPLPQSALSQVAALSDIVEEWLRTEIGGVDADNVGKLQFKALVRLAEKAAAHPVAVEQSALSSAQTVRDQALSEAVRICTQMAATRGMPNLLDAANAIRALQSQPASAGKDAEQDKEYADMYRWLRDNLYQISFFRESHLIDHSPTAFANNCEYWDRVVKTAMSAAIAQKENG